jgi:hypothetical protein
MAVIWREYLRRLKKPWIWGGLLVAVASPVACFGILTQMENQSVERALDFAWLLLVFFPLSAVAVLHAGLRWVMATGPRWMRPTCARCGYDLRMHRAADVCPECGQSDPMKHEPNLLMEVCLTLPGVILIFCAMPILLFGLFFFMLVTHGDV